MLPGGVQGAGQAGTIGLSPSIAKNTQEEGDPPQEATSEPEPWLYGKLIYNICIQFPSVEVSVVQKPMC